MPETDKMPMAVYRLESPERFGELDFTGTVEHVVAEINKKKNKKEDGIWVAQNTNQVPTGFEVMIYSAFKRTPPKWSTFIAPILADNSPLISCKNATYSFIAFISHKDETFAVTGGSGSLAIDAYVSQTFGLDILVRLIKRDSQVIKSIQEREVTGIVLGQTRFYRGDQRISDQDQFGAIYKELTAELDENILIKTLKFRKEDVKKEGSSCLAKSSFKINKSISFHDLLHLIKQLTHLLEEEPFFTLNKVHHIQKKKHNLPLLKTLNDKLAEDVYHAYKHGQPYNIDFCHKQYELYFKASEYLLQFDDGQAMPLDRTPSLSQIIDKVRKEGRLFDTDSVDFKHSVLYLELRTKDDQNTSLTEGTVLQHVHGEIEHNTENYFRVDEEWYQIKESFIKDLNKECTIMIGRQWNTTLIADNFPSSGKERDFNMLFIDRPGWLVFDTITPDNIEFCDILHHDGNNVYLIHVKQGFDNSFRDLAAQISIAAKRIRSDIREKFHYIDDVQATTKKGKTSANPDLRKMANQSFPPGGLKSLFKGRAERNIVFCLAFVDVASSQRSIKDNLNKFRSNIAKYMLLELHREIITLGFDFKIIQIAPHILPPSA